MAYYAKEKESKRKRPKRSSGRTSVYRDLPLRDSEDEEESRKSPVIMSDTKRARRCSESSETRSSTSARSSCPIISGQKRKQTFVSESNAKIKREDENESKFIDKLMYILIICYVMGWREKMAAYII